MFSRIISKVFIISLIVIASHQLLFSDEEVYNHDNSIGTSSENSFYSSTDPSNLGLSGQSVNLYTGQHNEAFPLVSLAGRGGLGVSLSLEYNGNVSQVAQQPNRKAQASPFGLGFDLGLQSIIANHKGTAYICDDEYSLVVGNTAIGLLPLAGDSFITSNGDPWVILRHRDTISNKECVIGWEIKHQDGLVYRYGDFTTTPATWNATRNILRWGDFVGSGVTNHDDVFPHQWDLKMIHDSDSLNYVNFIYARELDSLIVMDSNNNTTRTENTYVKSSRLSEVITADGFKVVINYDGRLDYQHFYGYNIYEFYLTKRAKSINIVNPKGDTISRTEFEYAYLDPGLDSSFIKLVLTSINNIAADKSDTLTPFRFEYYTDSILAWYGSISNIYYSSGASKELRYSNIDDNANYTNLEICTYSDTVDPQSYLHDRQYALAQNIFVDERNKMYGYWDGYWHVDTIPDSIDMNDDDQPAVSPEGWMACYDRSDDKVVVMRWKGGYWERDSFTDDTISRSNNVYMYPGNNCFILITGKYGEYCNQEEPNYRQYKRAYYYRWDGSLWHKYTIDLDHTEDVLVGVRLYNNVFAIGRILDDDCGTFKIKHYAVEYGKYDYDGDSLIFGPVIWKTDNDNKLEPDRFFVGNDFMACFMDDSCYFSRYDYQAATPWSFSNVNMPSGHVSALDLTPLPNGLVYTHRDGSTPYFTTVFLDGDTIKTLTKCDGSGAILELWGSSHSLSFLNNGGSSIVKLFEWTGNNWTNDSSVMTNDGTARPMSLYDDFYAYYGNYIATYNGIDSTPKWTYQNSENISSDVAGVSNYFVVKGKDAGGFIKSPIYINHYFLFRDNEFHRRVTDSFNVGPTFTHGRHYYATGDCFLRDVGWGFFGADGRISHINRMVDTLFRGKAPIHVVDSVILYDNYSEQMVITQYDYFGGLLDPTGNTPRFAKAKASAPYAPGETPDGYQVSCFYNDVDTSGFYDEDIYDYMSFPDLSGAGRYGKENGGYHLDGQVYLTYHYNSDDTTEQLDPQYFYYRLYESRDTKYNIYSQKLDSVVKYVDDLKYVTAYNYDEYGQQVVSTRTPAKIAGTYLVDSVIYAYENNDTIRNDNCLALAEENISFYLDTNPDPDTSVCYSRNKIEYEKHGSWQPVSTNTWRDIDMDYESQSDPIYSFRALDEIGFDTLGNLINSINALDDTVCAKYDPSGTQVIASATGCYSNELLVQGFEYGDGWDGWDLMLELYNVDTSNTVCFNGRLSLKVEDEVTSQYDPAAYRLIDADSLTTDKYYFSAWAKTNDTIRVYAWCLKNDLSVCDSGMKYLQFTGLNDEWTKIDGIFDLSNIDAGQEMAYLKFQLALGQAASGEALVYYDDVRFHPLDVHVTTSVYDPNTGVVTSESGLNNIPTRYEYDQYYKPTETKDYDHNLLNSAEYNIPKSIFIDMWAQSIGRRHYTLNDPPDTNKAFIKTDSKVMVISYYEMFCGNNYSGYAKTTTPSDTGIFNHWGYLCGTGMDCSAFDTALNIATYGCGRNDSLIIIAESDDCISFKSHAFTVPEYVDGGSVWAQYSSPHHYVDDTTYSVTILKDQYIYFKLKAAASQFYSCIDPYATNCGSYISTPSVSYELGLADYGRDSLFGWIWVDSGDVVEIEAKATENGLSCTYMAMFYTVTDSGSLEIPGSPYCYWDQTPGYIKSTTFRSSSDSTVSISYSDGFGRTLQTRTTNYIDTTERALVTGVAEYDSRGRVLKSYKPYYDLLGSTGVADYSPFDSMLAEVIEYYNGTNAPDCRGIPYAQNYYYDDFKGRLLYSVGFDSTYADTTRGVEYQYSVNTGDSTILNTVYDQDDNKTESIADKWGLTKKTISYYISEYPYGRVPGLARNIQIAYNNLKGQMDSVVFCYDDVSDIYDSTMTLNRYWYNELGQEDSTWRVDYGKIRMLYDKAGNLRFMQNDKRLSENKFVYYKYDNFGRKIEEGLCRCTLYVGQTPCYVFIQDSADSKDFPSASIDSTSRWKRYTYQYDYIDTTQSQVVYGLPALVDCHNHGYFQTYDYDLLNNKDAVNTRLLIVNGDMKKIEHEYDLQGNMKKIIFFPYEDSTDARAYEYKYDKMGRIKKVMEAGYGRIIAEHPIEYAAYEYYAFGKPKKKYMGRFITDGFPDPSVDTAQVLQYKYDCRDMLIQIADPDSVMDTTGPILSSQTHFAEVIDYLPAGNTYYNGLMGRILYKSSNRNSIITRDYQYKFNGLGWLKEADVDGSTTYDQKYYHNFFGNRTAFESSEDTIEYVYDSSPAGSSRLRWFTGMGSDSMCYDVLGNLVADTSRPVYSMTYEYRNLMDRAYAERLIPNQPYPYITNSYDESSRRIRKRYDYYYQTECGGIEPIGGMMMMGIPIEEEDTCIDWTYSEEHYLYDRGQLLAIFDRYDNVEQFYVNGPGGQVAVYKDNDQSYLYYFIKDHLGSTRVMIDRNNAAVQFVNYHPFGEIIESWSSYDEPLKFTSKERDLNSSFDYYYFGSRYYDQRIGQFASVDKAGQFPGGYLYGGANPLIGVDPDGNLFGFFIPILLSALHASAYSAVAYTAIGAATGADLTSREFWTGFGSSVLTGAISGAIGSGLGFLKGTLANNLGYQVISNSASSVASSAILGQQFSFGSIAAGTIGSVAGSMTAGRVFGNYRAITNNTLANIGLEIAHSAGSGMLTAGVGHVTSSLLRGEDPRKDIKSSLLFGSIGGASSALLTNAIYGHAMLGPTDKLEKQGLENYYESYGVESKPCFRSGGLMKCIYGGKVPGMAVGNQALIFDKDLKGIWLHEAAHVQQAYNMGFGNFSSAVINEYNTYGWLNTYTLPGTLEWQANKIAAWSRYYPDNEY